MYHITSYRLTCVHIQPCCFKNIVPHFKPDGISHSSTETAKLAPPLTRYLCPYVIREHKSAQPVWILVDAGPRRMSLGSPKTVCLHRPWCGKMDPQLIWCGSSSVFDLGSSIIKGRTFWASTGPQRLHEKCDNPIPKSNTFYSYESFDPSL